MSRNVMIMAMIDVRTVNACILSRERSECTSGACTRRGLARLPARLLIRGRRSSPSVELVLPIQPKIIVVIVAFENAAVAGQLALATTAAAVGGGGLVVVFVVVAAAEGVRAAAQFVLNHALIVP